MKKLTRLSFLLILIMALTGCSSSEDIALSDKIKAPENIKPPLEGKWKIVSYELNKNSNLSESAAETYIGKEILIDKEVVAVSANFTLDPNFKIKNVDKEDYLMYQYQVKSSSFLETESEEIQVVSVTGEDQFFYEFLVVEKDRAFVNIDGIFFQIDKKSNKVEEELIAEYYYRAKDKGSSRMIDNDEAALSKTGLLVGLKSPEEGVAEEEWKYRTIFLRFDNRKIKGAYEKENLFVPRKNGFWNVGVERQYDDQGNTVLEHIYSEPRKKGLDVNKKPSRSVGEKTLKNIMYLGNDYISIENVSLDEDGARYLEFYPLDNINKGKPLKITDVIGESGDKVFSEGMLKDDVVRKNIDLIDQEEVDQKNFGLFRRNGHWILKGRVNFIKNKRNTHRDFLIKSLIPDDIISYDELNVPWYMIRMKVPEAKDAFVSPNEDVVIIQTSNSLVVYSLDKGEIGNIPIMRIDLGPNEKVVMKEWAGGKYPTNWEEEFLKTDFKVLEYK